MGVVLVCLLLQQVTTATHACMMSPGMMGSVVTMPAIATDSAAPTTHTMQWSETDRLRCLMHCAQQASALSDTHQITVPAHLLVPLPLTMATLPVPHFARASLKPQQYRLRSPPRSAIRIFCSLLI
jgi:hypothetical protein